MLASAPPASPGRSARIQATLPQSRRLPRSGRYAPERQYKALLVPAEKLSHRDVLDGRASMVVVAEPVPSCCATMVFRGIVTGGILPAWTSAQLPPAWMWFMCFTPGSGRPWTSSVTSMPPSTSFRVAFPLTPEPRIEVRSTCVLCTSWAPALAARANIVNSVIVRAAPVNRPALYILLLRYSLATVRSRSDASTRERLLAEPRRSVLRKRARRSCKRRGE